MKFDTRKRRNRRKRPNSAKAANTKVLKRITGRRRSKDPAYVTISPEMVFALRQYLGMIQESFAAQLGVSKLAVSFWECGFRSPNQKTSAKLRELAEMNGVSLEKLADKKYYQEKTRVRVFMKPSEIPNPNAPRPAPMPVPGMETTRI